MYIDKKRTGPALDGKLTHTVQGRSILPPEPKPPDLLQDVSGFLPETIARYRETVKRKFPERFPSGERLLYQKGNGQLSFSFGPEGEARRAYRHTRVIRHTPEASPVPEIRPPLPNTADCYLRNFAAIAGAFTSDPIEAARYLLRAMTREERDAALAAMREAGCVDRASYHAYLRAALPAREIKPVDSLYLKQLKTALRAGDVVFYSIVRSLDGQTRSFTAEPLHGGEARTDNAGDYQGALIGAPDEPLRKLLGVLRTEQFYDHPDETLKARYYELQAPGFPVFAADMRAARTISEAGLIISEGAQLTHFNPYDKQDRERIRQAARRSVSFRHTLRPSVAMSAGSCFSVFFPVCSANVWLTLPGDRALSFSWKPASVFRCSIRKTS